MTPLMWAMLRTRRDAARTLLLQGADPMRRAPDGRTLIELLPAERRAEAEALLAGGMGEKGEKGEGAKRARGAE